MNHSFDAIVIGTGQAGPPLASRLSDEGLKTAVIERHRFGGTCVTTGCVPTKTIVASAYVAQLARRGAEYGVMTGPVAVDMAAVKARKDAIVDRSEKGIRGWMEGLENCRVFTGHARFEGPNLVRVGDDLLEAKRIFINTGGRALVPDIPGLADTPYFTNSSILELDHVPQHLIVVGGSYIGLEFAHAFRRFGARVTVVELADRLIAREDPEISEAVRNILTDEGVDIRLGAKCLSVSKDSDGVRLGLECGDGSPSVTGTHLLLAVGRRPNTDDLGLDSAGIATDKRGFITVDDRCQTNVPSVWALGDVNGRGAFTHTAYNDYEIVAANLFDNDPRKISDRIPCYGLFIDPPLGRVGLTETEARTRGGNVLVGRLPMARVGRARERAETKGLMKAVVDGDSNRILGAALLGIGGDEVAHTLLAVMAADAPYTTITRTMMAHPTVSEYLPTLLGDLEPSA